MTDDVVTNPRVQVATPAELAAAREARGMSQMDISQRIKLQVRQVNALEEGQWDALPGRSFVRGALRSYGKLLDVDVTALLDSIGGFAEPAQVQAIRPLDASLSRTSGYNGGSRGSPILWVIAGLVGVVALVLYFGADQDASRIRAWLPSGKTPTAPADPAPVTAPPASPASSGSSGSPAQGFAAPLPAPGSGNAMPPSPQSSSSSSPSSPSLPLPAAPSAAGSAAPAGSGASSSGPGSAPGSGPVLSALSVLPRAETAAATPSAAPAAAASSVPPAGAPAGVGTAPAEAAMAAAPVALPRSADTMTSGSTNGSPAGLGSTAKSAGGAMSGAANGAANGAAIGAATGATAGATERAALDTSAASPAAAGSPGAKAANGAATGAKGVVRLTAVAKDSWVEVRQADGTALHNGLIKAGETLELSGKPPYRLVLGNASHVELVYEGKVQDLAPHMRANNIARLQLK